MMEIPLSQGKVALVDDEDFDSLNAFKWSAGRNGRMLYAIRHVHRDDYGRTTVGMHRIVLARKLGRSLAKGEDTDHINGNSLDNRRENLRGATRSQNNRNCHRHIANPSSRFLGVSWSKPSEKWRVEIKIGGKRVYLGSYQSEIEAAIAREEYIKERPDLCARSNFNHPQNQEPRQAGLGF